MAPLKKKRRPYVCTANEVPGRWAGEWLMVSRSGAVTAFRTRDAAYAALDAEKESFADAYVRIRNSLSRRTIDEVVSRNSSGDGFHFVEGEPADELVRRIVATYLTIRQGAK
ncbi:MULTISPECIES: hypothetical protein [unclassified Bradyrhizobium]|uniref:hypothetical protein n=1 Tax=unclassified Bradyrhizobium TaxID=2631580 RepID=UPI0028E79CAC|nr:MULTISPECIES: hypothetical protein [unclassified Bradyrhizobium]